MRSDGGEDGGGSGSQRLIMDRSRSQRIVAPPRFDQKSLQSKFMKHAVDALTRCRLTLKWSYAMAFYLAQGNQKQIFEDLQA